MSEEEEVTTMTPEAPAVPVKPPMRTIAQDLPARWHKIGPKGRPYQPANDHERRLLAIFRIWMQHPQARVPLIELSQKMMAHEIRSYAQNKEDTSTTTATAE